MKVKSLSRVRLLATPWTVAHQGPPSMGFSRQECWSGVPLPSPNTGYLSTKIINTINTPTLIFNVNLLMGTITDTITGSPYESEITFHLPRSGPAYSKPAKLKRNAQSCSPEEGEDTSLYDWINFC